MTISPAKAQRVRRALPNQNRKISRRTPFCACSSKANRDRRGPPVIRVTTLAPVSVVRCSSKAVSFRSSLIGGHLPSYELAQNGARRDEFLDRCGGARRTL